ncbi:MAG: family 10 glycosylhydrolase [Candidatus Neomarinimicrobiota bacterium]
MKKRISFLILTICVNVLLADLPIELRAAKITNVDSDIMFSDRNIAEAMAYLDSININTVLVCVWNSNSANGDYTLYPSDVMWRYFGESAAIHPAFSGRDPLQNIIVEAHARGIEVMPWYEMGFSTSWSQQGGHILQKYPDWACKKSDGSLAVKNGFDWMSAINPDVQDFIRRLTLETCKYYDIDGIEYSDRIPAMPIEGGYEQASVDLYKAEHDGASPPSNHQNAAWTKWRADKLTDWYRIVSDSIKAIDNNLHVSSSPSVYPWSYYNYLQDPKTWMNTGICDDVIPQLYRKTWTEYRPTFFSSIANYNDDSKVFSGVCLYQLYSDFTGKEYLMDPEYIINSMQLNRDNGVMGEAWFFYEGFQKQFRHFFDEFDQSSSTTVGDTLVASFYSQEAQLPHRSDINWRPKTDFIAENDKLNVIKTPGWTRPAPQHLSQMTYRGDNIFYSTGNDTIEYRQDITEAGYYNIYAYNSKFSNASQLAPYIVGQDTFLMNQKDPESSGWRRLTTKYLENGVQSIVKVHSNASDAKPVLVDDVIALINRNSTLQTKPESSVESVTEPKDFSLKQNYPNPFNPRTTIAYAISKDSDIKLSIYDMSGHLIETLVNGFSEAGLYELTWDASKYSSGIYISQLVSGNLSTSKKMILIK